MNNTKKESSGIKDLDRKLGGLFIGDNVIIEAESGTFPELFIQNFVKCALNEDKNVVYVSFNASPLTLCSRFDKMDVQGLTLLDCFTAGKGKNEKMFQDFYKKYTLLVIISSIAVIAIISSVIYIAYKKSK